MKAAGILAASVCVNVALIGASVGTAAAVAAPANDKIGGATTVSALPFTQTRHDVGDDGCARRGSQTVHGYRPDREFHGRGRLDEQPRW